MQSRASPVEFEAGQLEDIEPAAMREVEHDGQKILLTRDADQVHAIGATCPHAGGPLAQGVRHGDRVICPWHKAAFCIRTGTVQAPPALDPVPRYDVRIQDGTILLTPVEQPAPAASAPDPRHFVIIGAGAAGAVAAQTLREAGFAGRVTMLDAANRVPYDRTILSKYALSGKSGAEKSPLQDQSWYREHRIERRTAEAVRIDPARREITSSDGASLPYDAALVATGGTPSRPNLPGAQLGHVYTLRSRADADAILRQAERSERAVILGASFIGMEVAASLRERGLEVTVIGKEPAPFAKQLGPAIGGAFVGLHEQHGVNFRLGTELAAIEPGGVRLQSGETISADLVVVGFGVTPSTSCADGLPLASDGGILVDAHLRAAPNLYAAGDIARFPHRGDGAPIRVEHWRVAQQHGRVAALNMLGQNMVYDAVPVFWTIQYMKRLDYVGHAGEWDEIIVHGDLRDLDFLAYYVKDGVVLAAAGMGRDTDTAALIALFTDQRDWRAEDLGPDPKRVLAARQPTKTS